MALKRGIFWAVLLLLFTLFFLWMFKDFSDKESNIQSLRVGICGQVNSPGIYDLYVGSDIGSLILAGGGISASADLSKMNLEELLENDSIYIVPTRVGGVMDKDSLIKLAESSVLDIRARVSENSINVDLPFVNGINSDSDGIESFNVLYVGQPALFVLISYYPKLSKLYVTNIPHSTLLLKNNYRLSDLYMTFGKEVFKELIQNFMGVKIDYWIYQDRFSFVRVVDLLDGIELSLDKAFVRDHPEHKLTEGVYRVNGTVAWDYVRFLDFRLANVKRKDGSDYIDRISEDAFRAKSDSWQVSYESRYQRQRYLFLALAKAFNNMSVDEKSGFMNRVVSVVETNITSSALLNIYLKMLSEPDVEFCSLTGYYKNEDSNLYFIPDIPSFLMLRNAELRALLKELGFEKDCEQVIY